MSLWEKVSASFKAIGWPIRRVHLLPLPDWRSADVRILRVEPESAMHCVRYTIAARYHFIQYNHQRRWYTPGVKIHWE